MPRTKTMTRTKTTRRSWLAALLVTAPLTVPLAGVDPAAAAGAQTPPETGAPAVIQRGFLRERDGDFRVAEPPGATLTKPVAVSNAGVLLFKYLDEDGTPRGAALSRGRLRQIEAPAAVETAPLGQNERGEIVGNYIDADGASHGFLRTRAGRYITIDHPDASGAVLDTRGTVVTNINNRGEMVGIYAADGRLLGFFRDRRGRFTTIDRPGTAATFIADLNDRGDIVGGSSQTGGEELLLGTDLDAFVLRRGTYRSIEIAGAAAVSLNGINNRGEMAGTFFETDGTAHGFLRSRTGRTTTVDHPHDAAVGTSLFAINDRGETVGIYLASAAEAQGARAAVRAAPPDDLSGSSSVRSNSLARERGEPRSRRLPRRPR